MQYSQEVMEYLKTLRTLNLRQSGGGRGREREGGREGGRERERERERGEREGEREKWRPTERTY